MITSFLLKIIALITMTFDHISYPFFHHYTILNVIGKISFPIFAFGIAEGYHYTKNLKKYFLRLFLFAIISQIPFSLFLSTFSRDYLTLNIFFTLLLGLVSITLFDRCKNKFIGWFSVILLAIIAQITKCDYGWYGISIIFLFYYFRKNALFMNISFICLTLLKYILAYLSTGNLFYLSFSISSCLPLILFHYYNGKQGKKLKYVLYIYYPIHLLLLYLIYLII